MDEQNNKWIGTAGGLAKFDDLNWEIYPMNNSDSPVNTVWAIAIDQQNTKWIGTNGGGLTRFNDVNWFSYNTNNSEIPENYICSIAIDSQDCKWIGTLHKGLTKFNNHNWQIFNSDNSLLSDNTIWDIKIDNGQNIWIGTNLGLALIQTSSTKVRNLISKNTEQPLQFFLDQNYPNPFKFKTHINFKIYQKSQSDISIYNIKGELVKNLTTNTFAPGSYSVHWTGRNENGFMVPNGTYFCCMKSQAGIETLKMLIIR